jgi:hypothetical protein
VRKAHLLLDRPHTRAVVVTRAPRRSGRSAGLFAALGVVIALVAGGLYLQRELVPKDVAPPEQAVEAFLAAVFHVRDARAVADVVCQGWDADEALVRTAAEVGTGPVSWDGIGVVSSGSERVIAKARVHARDPGGAAVTNQWRFSLLLEDHRWRVCEARPFTL